MPSCWRPSLARIRCGGRRRSWRWRTAHRSRSGCMCGSMDMWAWGILRGGGAAGGGAWVPAARVKV
eukprot:362040-Chlamydomonas_euryale.AAC.2